MRRTGYFLRVLDGGIAAAAIDEFVDQLVCQRARPRLEPLHLIGCERRQQDHARGRGAPADRR